MDADTISLVMRLIMLMFLAATSETAMRKRMYFVSLLTGAVWITVFRLAFLRAVSIYAGVFAHEPSSFIDNVMAILSSSKVSNWTDFLLLIAVLAMFIAVGYHKSLKNLSIKQKDEQQLT